MLFGGWPFGWPVVGPFGACVAAVVWFRNKMVGDACWCRPASVGIKLAMWYCFRGFLAFVLVVVAARGCGRCGFRAFRTQKAGTGECQHHSYFVNCDSWCVLTHHSRSVSYYTEASQARLKVRSMASIWVRSQFRRAYFSTAPAKGAFFKSEVLALLLDRSWVPGFSHLFGAVL